MAIVCRKCNYQIYEEEINEHYKGFLLNLLLSSIDFLNTLFLLILKFKKNHKDPEEKLENTLLGRANQYKIPCSRCFKYNGWMTIKDEHEEN